MIESETLQVSDPKILLAIKGMSLRHTNNGVQYISIFSLLNFQPLPLNQSNQNLNNKLL